MATTEAMSQDLEAAPRLCEILRDHRDRILDEWEAAVRASSSPSASLAQPDLRDDIPPFIDRLIAWLEAGAGDATSLVHSDTTGAHARHRLRFGVELRHLIHEFRLLRQIIMRHSVDAGCERAPACLDELTKVNDVLDMAMTETVSTYARERDESRDLLLGIIGHDLRNPLAAVAMASANLLHATSLDDVRAVGARIKRSADRIQRVVADLLDLARSRFGARMPITPEPLDLGEVVRAAVDELQVAHPGRRLVVVRRGDVSGSWDRARMGQLLSNLVGNAIQHGEDPVTVSVEGEEGGVILRVANRGAPIPKESIPSLFDAFRRGSSSGDTARLGLGLYIVAEIVRRHGGTIDVQSSEAETVFTIRLPRASGE